MQASFVSIDFETANSFRGSPCEVGLVKVLDGQIAGRFETYLRPPKGHDKFDPINTMIHGIQGADVRHAPRFAEAWPAIRAFIGDLPLVAHNAAFDTGVIRDALAASGLPQPELTYFCTLVLSRRILDLASYTLPLVAQELDVNWTGHHRAVVDAECGARVALRLLDRVQKSSLPELAESVHVRPGVMTRDSWSGCRFVRPDSRARGKAHFDAVRTTLGEITADPGGQLYGRNVVFTGTFSSMTRGDAVARVLKAGGQPQASVTRKTEFLIFGVQNSRKLSPGASKSSKFMKAETLRANGQAIELIDESNFLSMLTDHKRDNSFTALFVGRERGRRIATLNASRHRGAWGRLLDHMMRRVGFKREQASADKNE